jgi:hypothetical protein
MHLSSVNLGERPRKSCSASITGILIINYYLATCVEAERFLSRCMQKSMLLLLVLIHFVIPFPFHRVNYKLYDIFL